MLTYAKAFLQIKDRELKAFCEEQELDYNRISKLVAGTKGYYPRPGEAEIVGDWLGLSSEIVFSDAGPDFVKLVESKTKKKRRRTRFNPTWKRWVTV